MIPLKPKGWESWGALVHHSLGIGFYFYELLMLSGAAAGLAAFFLRFAPFASNAVFFIGGVLFWGGIMAMVAASKRRNGFINADLVVTHLTDTYVVGYPEYRFEKQVVVKAQRSGVESYKQKFIWTGGNDVRIVVEPASVGRLVTEDRNDGYHVMRLLFAKPLLQGHSVPFKLIFSMTDENRKAKPLFQKLVDDFYKNGFRMRVILPETPASATREIFISPRSELPVWTRPFDVEPHSKEIFWSVRKPRVGRRYRICWACGNDPVESVGRTA